MRLTCELEVVYTLALANGGGPSRSSRSRASICLGKKAVAPPAGAQGTTNKKEELFLIVSTAKNVAGNKYKVRVHYTLYFCVASTLFNDNVWSKFMCVPALV